MEEDMLNFKEKLLVDKEVMSKYFDEQTQLYQEMGTIVKSFNNEMKEFERLKAQFFGYNILIGQADLLIKEYQRQRMKVKEAVSISKFEGIIASLKNAIKGINILKGLFIIGFYEISLGFERKREEMFDLLGNWTKEKMKKLSDSLVEKLENPEKFRITKEEKEEVMYGKESRSNKTAKLEVENEVSNALDN